METESERMLNDEDLLGVTEYGWSGCIPITFIKSTFGKNRKRKI